jgi:hypothetical protein
MYAGRIVTLLHALRIIKHVKDIAAETEVELRSSGDGETHNAGRSGVFQGSGACGHCGAGGHKVVHEQDVESFG